MRTITHTMAMAVVLILVSVAVIVCGGCATCPKCVCPAQDMALRLPGLPFVLKLPKGGMDDPRWAMPFDKFQELQENGQAAQQGKAL